MDGTQLILYSGSIPLVGMLYVAPLSVSRPRGMLLRFALVFLGFLLLNLYFLVERYTFAEAVLRSAGVGLMPLVAGYLWARYGLPRLR